MNSNELTGIELCKQVIADIDTTISKLNQFTASRILVIQSVPIIDSETGDEVLSAYSSEIFDRIELIGLVELFRNSIDICNKNNYEIHNMDRLVGDGDAVMMLWDSFLKAWETFKFHEIVDAEASRLDELGLLVSSDYSFRYNLESYQLSFADMI